MANFMKTVFVVCCMLVTISMAAQREIKDHFVVTTNDRLDIRYILHTPKTEANKRLPLLIFLHGIGENGDDLDLLRKHGPLKYLENNSLDAFVLVPQCPKNYRWTPHELAQLIQNISKQHLIDTQRISLTGLGTGATAGWDLAYAYPYLLSAFVPIGGYVNDIPVIDPCRVKTTAIRIIHGLLDEVVDVRYPIEFYKKIRICNTHVSLEIEPNTGHDSWSKPYADPLFYQWIIK